jgi:outer membrane protein
MAGRLARQTALLLLGVCAASQARAEVVTLAALESKALANRPALQREAARAQAASADVERAASAYYPQFSLRGTADVGPGRQLLQVDAVDKNGTTSYLFAGTPALGKAGGSKAFNGYPRTGLELTASASLYDFGRTKAATEAARESLEASRKNREVTEAELLNAVRESYLSWLLAHQLRQQAGDALKEASARRERVNALISEGVKPKGELTPARADELLTRLELERAERDLEHSRLVLAHQSGIQLASDDEPDVALLQVEATLPDQSFFESAQRRALVQRVKAAHALAGAQTKLNRPQLGMGLSAGVRTSTQSITHIDPRDEAGNPVTPFTDRSETRVFPLYGAGLTLNIPLWDGGLTKASAAAARARAEEARANLAEFELERSFAQSQAELDSDSALTRLKTAEELVEVCAMRLKDAEDGYELGASSIDLIAQARSLLRRAQTEALMARVDHAAARLRMVRVDAHESARERDQGSAPKP